MQALVVASSPGGDGRSQPGEPSDIAAPSASTSKLSAGTSSTVGITAHGRVRGVTTACRTLTSTSSSNRWAKLPAGEVEQARYRRDGLAYRGRGFGPVAVTSRCGTQPSTW